MIKINGSSYEWKEINLMSALETLGFDPARIAVERNGEVVPRAQYKDTMLRDGDVLEVVRFVGGG